MQAIKGTYSLMVEKGSVLSMRSVKDWRMNKERMVKIKYNVEKRVFERFFCCLCDFVWVRY